MRQGKTLSRLRVCDFAVYGYIDDIYNANSRWVIANRDGIITSREGIEWEAARSSVDGGAIGARSVSYANGLWVAAGYTLITNKRGQFGKCAAAKK